MDIIARGNVNLSPYFSFEYCYSPVDNQQLMCHEFGVTFFNELKYILIS